MVCGKTSASCHAAPMFLGRWTRSLLTRVALIGALLFVLAVGAAPVSSAAGPNIIRYLGNDRYATAAKASEKTFGAGVAVAFVATGAEFPDALAGAPAAAKAAGPLLLTQRDALPAATGTELTRLQPHDIVVLGGPAAVGAAVVTQLGSYAVGGTVHRIQGADRYGTAAAVAAERFPSTSATVYVASGEGYADALAGGAAAGATGSPMLLVTHDAVPAATAEQLTRLDPSSIVLLGGTSSVASSVEGLLQQAATHAAVTRVGGTDRYDTAVLVAQRAFPSATKVFLATGADFPDALAGATLAPSVPGPVLLVPRDCVPAEVDNEIATLAPTTVVVLGGQGSVSDAAANGQVCEAAGS